MAQASAEKEATRRERAEKLHRLLAIINLESLRRRYSSTTQSAGGSDNGYMSARSTSAHRLTSPREATGNGHVFDELALVDAATYQDYRYALRESEKERMREQENSSRNRQTARVREGLGQNAERSLELIDRQRRMKVFFLLLVVWQYN